MGGTFAGTRHIYDDAGVLWRTVQTLDRVRQIVSPEGLRELIESVYGDDVAPVPASNKYGIDARITQVTLLRKWWSIVPLGHHLRFWARDAEK